MSSPPSHYGPSTQLIFDWDDTICPSSFIEASSLTNITETTLETQRLFARIAGESEKLLTAAAKYGPVLLITNSDAGWVHYSCEKYLPTLLPFLNTSQVSIISARTAYEAQYPNQPLCWKAAAFAHEVNERWTEVRESEDGDCDYCEEDVACESPIKVAPTIAPTESTAATTVTPSGATAPSCPPRQILSIGDSLSERTAVKIVASQLSALSKSVQFLHAPAPLLILGQVVLLQRYLPSIVSTAQTLDLEITQEQALRSAESLMQVSKAVTNVKSGPGSEVKGQEGIAAVN